MPGPKRTTRLVRPLRSGQITIPAEFRKALGITRDSLLQMTLEDGELRMKAVSLNENEGSMWLRELYEYFAPVREEIAASGVSETELERDIDRAVRAVRERRD